MCIANISRGGPGLGGIQPAQSDYSSPVKRRRTWRLSTYCPAPQCSEMMDFALLAFDLADRYRPGAHHDEEYAGADDGTGAG